MFWDRIRGKAEQLAEVTADAGAEEAAQVAASQRLGRLVSRQREEAEASPAHGNAASKLLAQFRTCAFFQLGVPLGASAADIRRTVDDLSFAEDVDPQALLQAQSELLSPRDRLAHELAWLPGDDAAFQQRVCAALKAGDCEALDALRFATSGLARINLDCALLRARSNDEALLASLLADLPRWRMHECQARIDEARLAAGIRPAEQAHFDEAAANWRETVATQIAEAAAATREGRGALGTAISNNAEAVRGATAPALEAVIAAYARIVDPRLQNMQAKMSETVVAVKAQPQQAARLTTIITTLDLWSQFRLPLQKLEQARGLDDPISARLFDELRDLGVELANTHKLHGETLRLARALKHAFSSVPGLQPVLDRDLPTIIGNVLGEYMVELAKDALQNLGKFCDEIRKFGFAPGAGARVARLIDCFEQFHDAQPQAEEPFLLMREIAIAANNKCTAPLLAITIIEWLLDRHPPQLISAQLTQDMCQLQQRLNKK